MIEKKRDKWHNKRRWVYFIHSHKRGDPNGFARYTMVNGTWHYELETA